jgi:hypothetical protein
MRKRASRATATPFLYLRHQLADDPEADEDLEDTQIVSIE